eukprot:jgi/Chlat1/5602/Chrsp369S05370
MAAAAEKAAAKAREYEAFAGRLRQDLIQATAQRDALRAQQRTFTDLAHNIELLEARKGDDDADSMRPLRMLVDVGAGTRMQAEVPDTSRLYVDAGLGFFVELTLAEALDVATRRQDVLAQRVEEASAQVAKVKAHLKLVYEGIYELMGLGAAERNSRRDQDIAGGS